MLENPFPVLGYSSRYRIPIIHDDCVPSCFCWKAAITRSTRCCGGRRCSSVSHSGRGAVLRPAIGSGGGLRGVPCAISWANMAQVMFYFVLWLLQGGSRHVLCRETLCNTARLENRVKPLFPRRNAGDGLLNVPCVSHLSFFCTGSFTMTIT